MVSSISTQEEVEKVILIAVCYGNEQETGESLDELGELVCTAGAVSVGRIIQNRENPHPVTYVGKGKLDEIKEQIYETGASGIVCDDELTPVQMKNIEQELNIKVMDRTLIILEIFAQRARTKEGIIQVELAQLKYRASRLIGIRSALSRQGGGIGSKGPGEKKLEMDRRLINARIAHLTRTLREIKRSRDTLRKQRQESYIPVIGIVGYTNAGKSTLLNKLTNAGVLEEDKLFATLDPTTRNLKLPNKEEVLLTDTVGFIRKLPHHLVEAFKSTLEEACYADVLIHVVDGSNPHFDKHMYVVYETLRGLDALSKPIITVFNKNDLVTHAIAMRDFKAERSYHISAKTGDGLAEMLEGISEILQQSKRLIERLIPYNQQGKLAIIRKYGQVQSESYENDGIYVRAYVPIEILNQHNLL